MPSLTEFSFSGDRGLEVDLGDLLSGLRGPITVLETPVEPAPNFAWLGLPQVFHSLRRLEDLR